MCPDAHPPPRAAVAIKRDKGQEVLMQRALGECDPSADLQKCFGLMEAAGPDLEDPRAPVRLSNSRVSRASDLNPDPLQ